MSWEIKQGDCRQVMATMAAESIDAIVSDPPYGLSFMGKGWDHGVPGVEFWVEALRVAKPGAHLLAFGGTRTYHRLACAIEDAGWEIRDCVMWVYGSGFPKSLDVSKAIDKRGGNIANFSSFRDAVREAMKRNGVSRSALEAALGNFMLSHYLTAGSQPAVPNYRDFKIIRDTVGLGDGFDYLFAEEAEREVVGTKTSGIANKDEGQRHTIGASKAVEVDITAPATDAARQWSGWGTALKPAWEPIIVARKPLAGTVAENVLEHGTGALNIDGCRVPGEGNKTFARDAGDHARDQYRTGTTVGAAMPTDAGRWPANLIHDGSDEVLRLFPNMGPSKASARGGTNPNPMDWGNDRADGEIVKGHDYAGGSAARFFYCAKASKADRDDGVAGGLTGRNNGSLGSVTMRKNHHPTVKPADLMRYLCRLVTPSGGLVLDPFCGSGSTGKAAVIEGFCFVGIEHEPEYAEIAAARVRHADENKESYRSGGKCGRRVSGGSRYASSVISAAGNIGNAITESGSGCRLHGGQPSEKLHAEASLRQMELAYA